MSPARIVRRLPVGGAIRKIGISGALPLCDQIDNVIITITMNLRQLAAVALGLVSLVAVVRHLGVVDEQQ